jgi:hypothetical protein
MYYNEPERHGIQYRYGDPVSFIPIAEISGPRPDRGTRERMG